jgi:hypothetical protein
MLAVAVEVEVEVGVAVAVEVWVGVSVDSVPANEVKTQSVDAIVAAKDASFLASVIGFRPQLAVT